MKCKTFEYDVNEIIPNLWLGNYKSAYSKKFINMYNIKHILTIMDNFDMTQKINGINHVIIPLRDIQLCKFDLIDLFNKTGDFINNGIKNGNGVLVHCKKGHHRSAAIVVGYLIKYREMNYDEGIEYINNLRPCSLQRETCMTKGLFIFNEYLNGMTCQNIKCHNTKGYNLCECVY